MKRKGIFARLRLKYLNQESYKCKVCGIVHHFPNGASCKECDCGRIFK
jgi:hypothetical protein